MTRIASCADPGQVLAQLVRETLDLVPGDAACVLRRDGDGAVLAAGHGLPAARPDGIRLSVDSLLDGLLRARGLAILDVVEPPFGGLLGRVRSLISVPLSTTIERLGVLIVGSAAVTAHDQVHGQVAATLGEQAVASYHRAVLAAQFPELSTVDNMAGVARRRQFSHAGSAQVAAAKRSGLPLAAIMLQLDGLVDISAAYGRAVADEVLDSVGARLRGQVRADDLVGRYGDDEFAIVLAQGRYAVAERLRASICDAPVSTSAGQVDVTVSLGVASLQPEDEGLSSLLRRADAALHRAKEIGRNRVVVA